MATIEIEVKQTDVYEEVGKATDYTGTKMADADATARDRVLATDDDLSSLTRFWDESVAAAEDRLKEMLDSSVNDNGTWKATLNVSLAFDTNLTASVQKCVREFFVCSIVGQWFKIANKDEAADYLTQAGDVLNSAERLLYSRKKPARPTA